MNDAIRLVPLTCVRCQSPLAAMPDEIAWVCSTCQQAQILTGPAGLQALDLHYSAAVPAGAAGKPFWVADSQLSLERQTYSGNESRAMQAFWEAPRRFYIPAYTLSLMELVETGAHYLQQQPVLQDGSPCGFVPVTLYPEDVQPMAEFILLGIEASRKDALQALHFNLQLSEPQLWILP